MKLLVSALEHSANIHLKALKQKLSRETRFVGVFDKRLGDPLIDLSALAVMGFVDAVGKLPFFLRLSRQMVDLARKADKVLLIDSSGFNLPLAKKIKKRFPDKHILYYILPQAWAWQKRRIPALERTVDSLASILPFEPGHYSKKAPIAYVGHPLLDEIPTYKHGLSRTGKIAFMPGSRGAEIRRLMPVYRALRRKIPCEAFLVIPPYFHGEKIQDLYGDLSGFRLVRDAHGTLAACDFAFVCSGTATLEAALVGVPFVLSYIAKPVDFFIAKRFVKLDHIGLANIMFTKFKGYPLHPELIQDEVRVENLLNAHDSMDRNAYYDNAMQLRAYLQHGSAARVAEMIEGSNGIH